MFSLVCRLFTFISKYNESHISLRKEYDVVLKVLLFLKMRNFPAILITLPAMHCTVDGTSVMQRMSTTPL